MNLDRPDAIEAVAVVIIHAGLFALLLTAVLYAVAHLHDDGDE